MNNELGRRREETKKNTKKDLKHKSASFHALTDLKPHARYHGMMWEETDFNY